MATPDPNGIILEEFEDGSYGLTAELWAHGNRRHRIARLQAIARNIKRDRWRCVGCGKPVPLYRRADARHCDEQCRKRAARKRRAIR